MWYFTLPPHKFWNVKLFEKSYSVENFCGKWCLCEQGLMWEYIYAICWSWFSYLRIHVYVNVVSTHTRIIVKNAIYFSRNPVIIISYSLILIDLVFSIKKSFTKQIIYVFPSTMVKLYSVIFCRFKQISILRHYFAERLFLNAMNEWIYDWWNTL